MLCLRRLESLPLATVLAGQTSRCLSLQLRDHQEGRRTHEQMTPMAAGLPRDDMRELGDYFAKQKLSPQPFTSGTETAQLSKLKTDETLCTLCQSGGFAGQKEVPRVQGQRHEYIVKQLFDFYPSRLTNGAGRMTNM